MQILLIYFSKVSIKSISFEAQVHYGQFFESPFFPVIQRWFLLLFISVWLLLTHLDREDNELIKLLAHYWVPFLHCELEFRRCPMLYLCLLEQVTEKNVKNSVPRIGPCDIPSIVVLHEMSVLSIFTFLFLFFDDNKMVIQNSCQIRERQI